MSCLVAKAPKTQTRTGVELVDKDEDADENVDAHQTRTERPVSGQSFTQLEEIDIHFRVQDCHMQLWKKQKLSAFKSSSRKSKVTLIEKHFKPTCSNVYKPVSNNSKAMIRELGKCRVIRVVRNNTESAMFSLSSLLEPRNYLLYLRTVLG